MLGSANSQRDWGASHPNRRRSATTRTSNWQLAIGNWQLATSKIELRAIRDRPSAIRKATGNCQLALAGSSYGLSAIGHPHKVD
jgi:hypothetical protein